MHALHEYLCQQLDEMLKKRGVIVFYDPRREFEPFFDRELQEAGKEARAVVGDQIARDQGVARLEVGFQIHLEQRADRVVVVEAQPVAIGGQDEQEVELALFGPDRGEETLAQEAVGDEGEAVRINAAHALGPDRSAVDAGRRSGAAHRRTGDQSRGGRRQAPVMRTVVRS